MTKSVNTVVEDIYAMLDSVITGSEIEIPEEAVEQFGKNVQEAVTRALSPRTKARKEKVLYFSEVGKPCVRALWYNLNGAKRAKLQPHNLIKFLYGDILEELLILLVKAAGHEVTDEQKTCEIDLPNGWKMRGRMDFKIDGTVVDAKSASSYAFKKFEGDSLVGQDPFGYLAQLAGYAMHEGEHKDIGFLVIDKQNGTLVLHQPHEVDLALALPDWEDFIEHLESAIPPARLYEDKAFGKSGNMCLNMECSYCDYKETCWADANKGTGLRMFVYSGKPVYMTNVTREPKVNEVDLE